MYVTINVVDKACDFLDRIAEQSADTEEIFEECYEELYPTAPLAVPEVFGKWKLQKYLSVYMYRCELSVKRGTIVF